ncbi:MAG: ABC transporter permease [Acidobacteria bacterium]|nr:ABC transporter permease [Acidobacteriota bacterium]
MRIAVFLLKRLSQLIVISLLVALATFCLSSVIPGDFFSTHLLDASAHVENVEQLRHKYGLDQPALVQYWNWLKNVVRLDLGVSLFYQRPVLPVVADALANTLWLGVPALILGFALGILAGTFHGITQRNLTGRILDFFSAITLSLPSLLLGLTALLFAAHTNWFPIGSMTAPVNQDSGFWSAVIDRVHHLILPVACLTIPIFAYVERIQCAAARDSRNELYVRFAHSRGLSRRRIFFQYILRPGLNPVVSISGPMIGGILSGSLVLEVIFTWPGLGQITYDALFNSDLFLLAGCILAGSLLLVAGNMLADCILIAIDPRIRSAAGKGL